MTSGGHDSHDSEPPSGLGDSRLCAPTRFLSFSADKDRMKVVNCQQCCHRSPFCRDRYELRTRHQHIWGSIRRSAEDDFLSASVPLIASEEIKTRVRAHTCLINWSRENSADPVPSFHMVLCFILGLTIVLGILYFSDLSPVAHVSKRCVRLRVSRKEFGFASVARRRNFPCPRV